MNRSAVHVDNRVMSKRTLVILAMLVAGIKLTAQTSRQPSVPAGVLVGIHRVGGYASPFQRPTPSSLQTVWLDADSAATLALPGLLVPRSSGFWRIGLTSNCSEELHSAPDDAVAQIEIEITDALWSSPIGARPRPDAGDSEWNCLSPDVFCGIDRTTGIYWVWPDFISLSRGGEYGCGAHPDSDYEPEVHRLDDLVSPLTIGTVFGPSAELRLRDAYERAKRAYLSRHQDGCEDPDPFSPTAWHIERQRGRWLLQGWADTDRLCEVGIDYSVDINFDRITGSRSGQRPLPRSLPDVKDAFTSGDGRKVLLIRDHEVALARRETPGRPIATFPLSTGDSVVMAEWAYGRNVAKWRDQMRKLAAP